MSFVKESDRLTEGEVCCECLSCDKFFRRACQGRRDYAPQTACPHICRRDYPERKEVERIGRIGSSGGYCDLGGGSCVCASCEAAADDVENAKQENKALGDNP